MCVIRRVVHRAIPPPGIYVPGFADEMLKDPLPGVNFKGFAVGDGLTGCKPQPGKPANWCVALVRRTCCVVLVRGVGTW